MIQLLDRKSNLVRGMEHLYSQLFLRANVNSPRSRVSLSWNVRREHRSIDKGGPSVQAFNLGGERNYVKEDIVYDDIFGTTHHTVYCYWIEPPPVRQPGIFPPSTFTMCGDHNKVN
jgi:hypothetical protein